MTQGNNGEQNAVHGMDGQHEENKNFSGTAAQECIRACGNGEMNGGNRDRGPAVSDVKKKSRAELMRAVKFTLFSISAGIIEISLYTLLDLLTPWPYWPCYLIALVASVLWNFTLNRQYTFQSANNVPVAMLKVAAFYAVFTPVTTVAGNYLAETAHWPGILVTLLNMLCNFVLEYLYDRYFVFGKSIDTNERAKKATADDAKHT